MGELVHMGPDGTTGLGRHYLCLFKLMTDRRVILYPREQMKIHSVEDTHG